MLYNLLEGFFYKDEAFQHFAFLGFRCFLALMTSFIIGYICTSNLIKWMHKKQLKQPIRKEGIIRHLQTKQNTPTMGGLVIVGVALTSTLIWSNFTNLFIWIVLFVMLSYGTIGFVDDYYKIKKKDTGGFKGSYRLILQVLIATICLASLQLISGIYAENTVYIPFFKNIVIDLGFFYAFLAVFMVTGSANSVNITDGLDGLVTVPVIISLCALGYLTVSSGSMVLSGYINVRHIEGTAELAVLCSALIGGCMAFLWYNIHPAKIFMGDVGSLALGGTLGIMAVIVRHELAFGIIGFLFVMEACSVILQVGSFKLLGGKRIFKMAPIHHHFEKSGWSEEAVVIRFWMFSLFCALIGMASIITV